MKRIDGYLWLDDCEVRQAHEHSYKNNHYWVIIDGEEYYFKPTGLAYRELISYHAAKLLGIDACYCDLAVLNGKYGIISKSLRKDGISLVSGTEILNDYANSSIDVICDMGFKDLKFYLGLVDDIKCDYSSYFNNLEIIWQALEWRCVNRIDIQNVMQQFVLMFIFCILINDPDKIPGNWLIEEGKNDVKLASLFDHGKSFEYDFPLSLSTSYRDYQFFSDESLEVFLKTSSSEYFDLFVEKFEKLILNFDLVIYRVEKQIGREIPNSCKQQIIQSFKENIDRIDEVLFEFNYKKKCKLMV